MTDPDGTKPQGSLEWCWRRAFTPSSKVASLETDSSWISSVRCDPAVCLLSEEPALFSSAFEWFDDLVFESFLKVSNLSDYCAGKRPSTSHRQKERQRFTLLVWANNSFISFLEKEMFFPPATAESASQRTVQMLQKWKWRKNKQTETHKCKPAARQLRPELMETDQFQDFWKLLEQRLKAAALKNNVFAIPSFLNRRLDFHGNIAIYTCKFTLSPNHRFSCRHMYLFSVSLLINTFSHFFLLSLKKRKSDSFCMYRSK